MEQYIYSEITQLAKFNSYFWPKVDIASYRD